jgi:hypothetical protein
MPVTMYDQTAHALLGVGPLLGQSARAAKATNDIWFYLAVLVVASVVIVAVGLVLRKMLAGPIEAAQGEAVFSLSDLRRMHREGMLTDEEYRAARSATLVESGLSPDSSGAPKPAAARRETGPPATEVVEESRLGPELLDPKGPPAPGSDSDNSGGDSPEANPGSEPEK